MRRGYEELHKTLSVEESGRGSRSGGDDESIGRCAGLNPGVRSDVASCQPIKLRQTWQ